MIAAPERGKKKKKTGSTRPNFFFFFWLMGVKVRFKNLSKNPIDHPRDGGAYHLSFTPGIGIGIGIITCMAD